MSEENKIPQLRVCVTGMCDKACICCRPNGEYLTKDNEYNFLTLEDFIKAIDVLSRHGVTDVRLTGGEPMLYGHIYELIRKIKQKTFVKKISLVTRSKNLSSEALNLKDSGLDSITISIDSLRREKVYQITKCDILNELIEGARKCSEIGIPVRINTVLMKDINDSEQEFENFIKFLGELDSAKWKILDYMILPGQNGNINDHQYFINLQHCAKKIKKMGGILSNITTQAGGLGTPMTEYLMPNGVSVFIKDSTKGSHYSQECVECKMFPCQDALMALRLTPTGNLQTCLYRTDKLIHIHDYIRNNIEKYHFVVDEVLSYYKLSEFRSQAWTPENLNVE